MSDVWKIYSDKSDFTRKVIEKLLRDRKKPDPVGLAEEINQELWVEHLPKKFISYDPEQDLDAWLSVVAKHYAMDYLRKMERIEKNIPSPCFASRERFHNYSLRQVVEILQEISRHAGDPAENAQEKEFIAMLYCSVELTAFGAGWEIARKKLDNDRGESSYADYLVQLANENIPGLVYRVYSNRDEFPGLVPYNPYLIRAHIIEGVEYRVLAKAMECSADTVKDRMKRALELFSTISRKFDMDLQDYCEHRDIGFHKKVALVFKLLGVQPDKQEEILQKLEEHEELREEIEKYGLQGAILKEQIVNEHLRPHWDRCDCDRKNKNWLYCQRHQESIFGEFYRAGKKLQSIFDEIGKQCNHPPIENFGEFQKWFQWQRERFQRILSLLGLSVERGIFYYRWVLK